MSEATTTATEAQAKLFAALAAAQGEFLPVLRTREVEVKTKAGYTYRFKYAPLDTLFDATRTALCKHNIAITQVIANGILKTVIVHAAGGVLTAGEVPLTFRADASAQERGSELTYIRRYSYQTALGLAAEEDDDANAAAGNHATEAHRPAVAQPAPTAPMAGPAATAALAAAHTAATAATADAPKAPKALPEGVQFLRGVPDDRQVKPTATGKPRAGLKIDGQWYSTFDTTLIEVIEGLAKGLAVEVAYKTNEKGYHNMYGLRLAQPIATAPAPALPGEPAPAVPAVPFQDDIPF